MDLTAWFAQAQHQLQPTQQEDLELPEEMDLDGGPGDQEGPEEGPEDGVDEEAGADEGHPEPADPSHQPFPEQPVTEGPEPELAGGEQHAIFPGCSGQQHLTLCSLTCRFSHSS